VGPNHREPPTLPYPKREVPKVPGLTTAAALLESGWEPVKKEKKESVVSVDDKVKEPPVRQCPTCASDMVQGRGYGGKVVWGCPGCRS